MAGSFGAALLGNLLSVPLSHLLAKRYALVAALSQAFQGVFLILLALLASPLPAAALFWLVYASRGVLGSPHATLLHAEIPATHRSAMLSVSSLVAYAGGFLGSAGLGFLAEGFSIGLAWAVAGAALLLSVGFYVKVNHRATSHPAKERAEEAA